MNNNLPNAESIPRGMSIEKIKNQINQMQLVGLANNTKWNELINAIRSKVDIRPSYRSKWINGFVSDWDVEWYYHLPFPFVGVMWLEISLMNNDKVNQFIINLVKEIGFVYMIDNDVVKIFGYAPRD